MSEKRNSTSPSTTQIKRQRKTICIEEKLEVINRLEKGERIANVCRALGWAKSTVRTIRNNADRIKESAKSGTKVSAKRICYSRSSTMERMEKMLSIWIEDQNQRHLPISMLVVQAKARSIYEDLSKDDDNAKPFNASSGWFWNFTKRYNFHTIKVSGEAAPADTVAAEEFVKELQHIIEKGGYLPKQIFNINETSLFWKRMPSRTYISQEDAAAKDRFTLLLGGNAQGDCKLKPVMVYHSANPCALKGYVKHLLPVHFYSNAKGWITGSLFIDYMTSKLEGELREYCAKENLDFKILLIVDSAAGHPTIIQDLCEHIQVAFIPPNSTSLIQPMDHGVIATFKTYYLKKTFDMLVKAVDDKNMSVKEFWKSFTIRDAIMLVGEAWAAVTSLCMNGVWKHMCPYLVHDCKGFTVDEDLNQTIEKIVQLANIVGFNEVDLDDVVDVLMSDKEELSNEDLIELEEESREGAGGEGTEEGEIVRMLTSERLSEALRIIDEALAIFDEEDPNTERSSKVKRDVLASVRCYAEILKERKMKVSQRSLDYFKTTKRSVTPEPQPSTSGYPSAEQLPGVSKKLSTSVALPLPTSSCDSDERLSLL
jgi:DDE superfamily endonuclease./Tc5 transposase DNA-binding domain./CENP-B N-terminal DNA-binding domain.